MPHLPHHTFVAVPRYLVSALRRRSLSLVFGRTPAHARARRRACGMHSMSARNGALLRCVFSRFTARIWPLYDSHYAAFASTDAHAITGGSALKRGAQRRVLPL